ncbi:MFS transporter [Corynebacterium amycolatum]|uniref:MFS transporter n=1 Tax=Corynebacterium amycolatum TaxID=43765 RepID=UPI00223BBEA2|nr:MFS transporter [Corynebacterium amycolatum]MCT1548714.1 MFS transporter [Corynebacterium amycolatum]
MTTHTTTQTRHKQNEQDEQRGQDKLFSPAFIISWLINFSMYLVFYLSITVMALYAVQRFSASDAAGGFAASSFVVGATIARLFSGYLVDTFGGRKIMLGSLTVIVAACAAYIWAASLPILITIRIIHGLTYAFASTAVMAAAQTAIPASRRAEGTGYISLGTTLATAIGPALGLALIGSVGYSVLFATALGLSVIGLVLALVLPQHTEPTTVADKAEATEDSSASETKRAFSFDDIMTPSVVPIGLFMLLVGLAYAGVITFLNRYSQLSGLTRGASFFFIAYAVAMMAARFSLGRLQDRRGDNPVIAIGLVCFTISLLVLAFASADWHVIAAGALCGLGYGTLMPACQTISVHLAPAHKLGTGISTLLLLVDAGIGLGPIVLGSVAATMGFDKMYAGLAVVVVLAAVFYWFVHGRKPVARRHRVDL